ncbi:hypothetical protein HY991_02950 [Candidatus Micrarchaeota archaeon]|nr:hypothetical protein [Candidatus Micrarchaeota archaeon]
MDSRALIEFLKHLAVIDHNYVMHRFASSMIEETNFYSPEQLRNVEQLIRSHKELHEQTLEELKEKKGPKEVSRRKASRYFMQELQASLSLRGKIQAYLAVAFDELSDRRLTPSEKAILEKYLSQWENWRGIKIKELNAPRNKASLLRRIAESVEEKRGSLRYNAERIPDIRRLIDRVERSRELANRHWGYRQ